MFICLELQALLSSRLPLNMREVQSCQVKILHCPQSLYLKKWSGDPTFLMQKNIWQQKRNVWLCKMYEDLDCGVEFFQSLNFQFFNVSN